MRIRSQLEAFSQTIADVAQNWDGSKVIHFQVPVKQETRQIDSVDEMCKTLNQRVDRYVVKDQSLQGKIETLDTISSSLVQISNRAYSLKPWYMKVLSFLGVGLSDSEKQINQVKHKVDNYIQEYRTEKRYIETGATSWLGSYGLSLKDRVLETFIYHGSLPQKQIVKSAFRVVKEVDTFMHLFLDKQFGGASFFDSTREIREEFEEFHNILSPELQAKTAPFLRSLKLAEELGKHLSVCSALLHSKGTERYLSDDQIERYIKHQSADMAYQIEKAVKELPNGESIVIPGGFFDTSGGHAVATTIKKIEGGACQIACYNTGYGAEEGQGILGLFSMMVSWNVKVPTFEPVPVRRAVKQAMIINLLDLSPKDWEPSKKVRSFMQRATSPPTETLKGSIRLQTWGTCSFDSIMSYLSHDMPSGLFLLFQLHTMQKAYSHIQAKLPAAEREKYFGWATLQLLKRNPQQTINAHVELCRNVFGKFFEYANYLPDSVAEIKVRLQRLKQLKEEQAGYTASYFAIGRPELAELNDKIAAQSRIIDCLKGMITLAATPAEIAEIQVKSHQELLEWFLASDLSFVSQYKSEMQELSALFHELQTPEIAHGTG